MALQALLQKLDCVLLSADAGGMVGGDWRKLVRECIWKWLEGMPGSERVKREVHSMLNLSDQHRYNDYAMANIAMNENVDAGGLVSSLDETFASCSATKHVCELMDCDVSYFVGGSVLFALICTPIRRYPGRFTVRAVAFNSATSGGVFRLLAVNMSERAGANFDMLWRAGFRNCSRIGSLARSGIKSIPDVDIGAMGIDFWQALVNVFYPDAQRSGPGVVSSLKDVVKEQVTREASAGWADTYQYDRQLAVWKVSDLYFWVVRSRFVDRIWAFGYCEDPVERQRRRDEAVVLSLLDRVHEGGLLEMIARLTRKK